MVEARDTPYAVEHKATSEISITSSSRNNHEQPTSEARVQKTHHRKRTRLLLCAVVAVIAVLAVGLGIGLGVGLNKSKHAPTYSTGSANSSSDAQSSLSVPSWRSHVKDYSLDLKNWDFYASPTTRIYNLTLSEVDLAPDGVPRLVLAINGGFPGPLIRANRGDRLLIHVQNHLSNATSIHWHGLYQNETNYMDGTSGITQCPIAPGASFLYNFTLNNQFGTYWYHTHYSTQNGDGPVGPLIIHAPEEIAMQKNYDFDQVILVQDWYHDYSQELLPGYLASGSENSEPVPDNGLIQGTNYFNCSLYGSDSGYKCFDNSSHAVFTVQEGMRYRYRLINAGAFATFQFSIDNHPLSVIEADGTAVEPLSLHRLQIAVAQRYSFVINANQSSSSNYWMRAQMNTFCFGGSNPVLNANVQALITYTNSTSQPTKSLDWTDALDVTCAGLNSSLLTPSFKSVAPPATTLYSIQSNFQIGVNALDRGFMNGTSWTMSDVPTLNQAVAGLSTSNKSFSAAGVSSAFSSNQYVIDIPKYAVVDLLITNYDEGAHPFHLHGHTFWIVESSPNQYFDWSTYDGLKGEIPDTMRRDTVMIDAFGWTLIRFVADNPGLWAFHCHISWHMEAGLLMQFQTRDDIMSTWTLPSDVLGLLLGLFSPHDSY